MKRLVALLIAAIMMISLCACSKDTNDDPSDSGDATTNGFVGTSGGGSAAVYSAKDSVVFRLNADIATLDPHKTSGTANERIVQIQFYESLFGQDRFNDTTEINPRLAESWQYLDDEKLQMEITLRKGVKFHNGDEMTADDVVFSLNRAKDSGYSSTLAAFWESVEKIDDYTVVVHLTQAYGAIEKVLATPNCSIVCKKFTEESGDNLERTPCGTGPYVLSEWITGDSVTVTAFADYWRGEAAIKTGKFVIITDNSTYLIALENGEVDISNMMGTADVQTVIDNPDLSYTSSGSGNSGHCILFNCGEGSIFADERMRLAVAAAIDRESIYISAFDGNGTISTNIMSMTVDEYPENFEAIPFDLEYAKQLVIDAGYPDGVTISVPTIEAANYNKPAIVIQEQLGKIGIHLELDVMTRAAWNEKVIGNSDFQITNWAVVPDFEDADAILYKLHSNSGVNFYNINDPELDALLDAGRALEPGEERNQIYLEALELIRDKAYAISFLKDLRNVSYNSKLQGVVAFPEQRYQLFNFWWAE
ncbi:MAG: ABC transporter substrate-binding protein [Clostridia bacterium]|nr:ABC transporter substrate-binding protein [Clostridia bacterium]